jgi:hypothetical protein
VQRDSSEPIKVILARPANLAVVRDKLRSGQQSRTRLAAWTCRRFRFQDARGRPRVFSCLKALRGLERAGHFQLPPRLITVMDREGDIFELFEDAEATRKRVGVLVRSRHHRRLKGRTRKLFETLKAGQHRTSVEVFIPRQRWKKAKRDHQEQKGLPGRQATLSIHFQEITLTPTRSDLRSAAPLPLCGVYAREENPPADATPIEWLLLTTEEVKTPEGAARIVGFYCRRWRIEEWHRVLKSGCKAEEHQHETAERLQRAIAIDIVLAWRIQLLTLLGRQPPKLPCAIFLRNGK